jgi:hypothetical protein
VLIEQVFNTIKLPDFAARLNVAKDAETSRLTFHMLKLFCHHPSMHEQIIGAQSDIVQAIF